MSQLGDTLRERRISLGITLDQAESDTKIRGKLLSALEDGAYDKLPNPGYVRGYVSSYSRYLELDSVPLLAMYRAETGAGRYHDITPPDTAVSPRHEQHEVPWRLGVVVMAVLALLSFGIWAALRLSRGPEKPPPIPTTPAEKIATTSPVAVPPTQASDAREPSQKPPAKLTPFTVRVTVASGGASWLEITVDGKSAYEGSLTGERSKSFEVTSKAILKIGRPSAVSIYRDGKKVDIPDNGGTPTVTLKAKPAP